MLTSFFSKSKPINFLAVVVFMTIFFILANYQLLFSSFDARLFFAGTGALICLIISIGVINFIAKKNELTKRSAYKIIIFAVFAVSFWEILRDYHVIVANLCVLLALRRIISLKSQKEIQQKIFDATFWICIASLFYFWTILFLVIVYSGILLHASNYFKNWLVPIISFMTVFALATSYDILANNSFYQLQDWYQPVNFNFQLYNNPVILVPLSVMLALTLWTLFYYLGLMQRANINSRPTYILVLLTLVIAIGIALFAPNKNGSELLFFFIPLSIIASNYFESKREKVFKDILMFALIIMPVLIPFLM